MLRRDAEGVPRVSPSDVSMRTRVTASVPSSVEDADPEVDQLQLVDLRVDLREGLPQRVVEGVDRAVPLPRRDEPPIAGDQLHGGLRHRQLAAARVGDDAPRLDVEVGQVAAGQRVAQQQLERRVRRVEGVARAAPGP